MANLLIEICRAKKEDFGYIEEKLEKYILDATCIDWQQFFVLKNDGKTVAFARIIDRGEYFELASLGVDYYHRKKGFGTQLLEFLVEEAKRQNPQKPIYGVTHKPGFLKNAGFKEVYIYPRYLEYKRNYICKLDASRIKIMRYKGKNRSRRFNQTG